MRFDRERMREAASDELIAATDVADLLVRLGVPFREAHGVVAGLVRTALDSGRTLSELTRAGAGGAQRDARRARASSSTRCSTQASWLESKVSEGGTASARACASSSAAARDGRCSR